MVNKPLTLDILPDDLALTVGGFSALLGVSVSVVHDRLSRGLLRADGRNRMLVAENVRLYADELRLAAGRHGAGHRDPAKVRLTEGQARLVELKVAQAEGRLLDAAEVEREWGDLLRQIRAGMLSLSSRLGARIPSLTRAEVEVIDDEVRQLLTLMGSANVDPAAKRREAIAELIG